MKPWAKLGYLAAACALLITTFSIIGPRAVRAAVATLVQVVNTSANPIPTVATDNPALTPFSQDCFFAPASNTSISTCLVAVPAGEEVVVQTVSLFANPTNSDTALQTQVLTTLPGDQHGVEYGFAQKLTGGSFVATMNATLQAQPSSSIECLVRTQNDNPGAGISGTCYVNGYYVKVP